MSDDGSEEKTEAASDRKLKKLRDDGIVASSQIGSNFAGLAMGLGVTLLLLPMMIERLKQGFTDAFEPRNSSALTDPGLIRYYLVDIMAPIGFVIIAIIVASVGLRILVNGGFLFSLTHVAPSLDKVSPVKGLQNLFKGKALTEFGATFVRFVILLVVCILLAVSWGPTMLNLDLCVPNCAGDVAWRIVRSLLIAAAAVALIAIIFDIGVQKAFFLVEQKMTQTEVKKEQKEMLGQPEIRQERRRLQRDSAQMAGTVGVSVATAYFTYGDRVVALVFDPVKHPLPKIAAKSRVAKTTIEMIQTLEGRGVPGMEDEQIVAACELLPNGSNAPRKIFMQLATKLRELLD